MSYKEALQGNNTDLQSILNEINELPDRNSVEYVEVTLIFNHTKLGTLSVDELHFTGENGYEKRTSVSSGTTIKILKGSIFYFRTSYEWYQADAGEGTILDAQSFQPCIFTSNVSTTMTITLTGTS